MKNTILGILLAGGLLYVTGFIFNHISPWAGIGFVAIVLLSLNKFLKSLK